MRRLVDETDLMDMLYTLDDARHDLCYAIKKIPELPTIEAIPKDQYEQKLKADMVAMLKELKTEIDKQCKIPNNNASAYDWNNGVYACYKVVQQKIDALKADGRTEEC
jgi:hypothetical protein